MHASTAILIFLRSVEDELLAKNWTPFGGLMASRMVVKALNHRVQCIAQRTGIPTFVLQGAAQQGTSFGQRLANGIQSIYDKGFDQVICIGNDCPALSTPTIRQAAERLSCGELVLGPDQAGGAYLIGMPKARFQQEAFVALPWQRPQLFDTLQSYAKKVGAAVSVMEKAQTANTAHQLQYALYHIPNKDNWQRLIHTLLRIPSGIKRLSLLMVIKPSAVGQLLFRGPPIHPW